MNEIQIYKQIVRYIDGKLSQEETEQLWEEFVKYPEYYKMFETELHLRDVAREANENGITSISQMKREYARNDAQEPGFGRWIYAIAATLIFAFGLYFLTGQEESLTHPDTIASIHLNELTGADIVRSDDAVTSNIDVEINRGLALAYAGDTERAISKFSTLLFDSPEPEQKARIQMNLGILYYNKADFENAIIHFEPAAQVESMNRFFREKAWWFLGNAYLNLEMLEEARGAVTNAYQLDGRFHTPAEEILDKLNGRP
jgi:tetratricopeptide (TPR) repeat protein